MRWTPVCLVGFAVSACGSRHIVRIVPDGSATSALALPADPTFEVVARIAGVRDPLRVGGADIVYADLQRAAGQAVVRAVTPRHDHVLTVELIAGDAQYDAGRLSVSVVARVTLRTRLANAFVGQAVVVCRDGAIVVPEDGSRVMWSCLTRLGKDIAGWLDGLPAQPITEGQ